MRKENTISIFIDKLRVNVSIGLYEGERQAPQAVDVSVELRVAPDYLTSVDAASIVDYGKVHDAVMAWEVRDHVDLIESYAKELLDFAFSFASVREVFIQISKPDILETAQGAGVRIDMDRNCYESFKAKPLKLVE